VVWQTSNSRIWPNSAALLTALQFLVRSFWESKKNAVAAHSNKTCRLFSFPFDIKNQGALSRPRRFTKKTSAAPGGSFSLMRLTLPVPDDAGLDEQIPRQKELVAPT
jgi:hypothetical protein